MAKPVPENINFPKEEENILKLWAELDAFKTSLKQSEGKPRYTFYDGPPFATGLPHYGHILAGTIKDIVTRFAHQSGFHVERRFGWDCHGLPVEYEIDKALGIKGPGDVAKLGIENYNNECRKIVMHHHLAHGAVEIDFKKNYKTLYSFFWSRCVIISFPLVEDPDVSLIAWTTTRDLAQQFGAWTISVFAWPMASCSVTLRWCVRSMPRMLHDDYPISRTYVKDADKAINKYLKEHGRLVHASQTKHSYPFATGRETPLIYKAVPELVVRVEPMIDDCAGEQRTPAEARDWPISRSRYWGTPIPLWISDDGERWCVGSIEELATLTGTRVTDLHRETVDKLEIPSQKGKGMLKRIPEVFDCWLKAAACRTLRENLICFTVYCS
ncbi:Isoleucine--tRNA ligase, cytoplasmic [Hypsibius exemplaris]|uniref:Isoleucine--tRNA ligase, cytoplasmic n=1 Tax=Hypsibius exemplaris TaxID=2072580 RepID=A0A1W0XAU3_HYPEX|nr:Isoleucine--tRNA ligase, cytoplasmic [Hypsibius exemplaris]